MPPAAARLTGVVLMFVWMREWISLGAVAGLIFLNGLLVAAEFAFVRARRARLESLRRAGSRGAGVALGLLRTLDSTLATTQVGITLANLGIGWMGEPAAATLLAPVFDGLGLEAYGHPLSFGLAFIGITFVTVVLGELMPRAVAIQRAETIAIFVSEPLAALRKLLYPLVTLTNRSASAALRISGIPMGGDESAHTVEELRTILTLSHDRGHLSRVGRDILDRALGFSRLTARQIMVPRPDVVWLSTTKRPAENLEIARASGYTRFPVCEGDLDRVLGIVHIKDVLLGGLGENLTAIMRAPIFVPETATADRLLRIFQKRALHMAIVVDEYGGTSGIVTLEDVLEEIVGEVRDEFDEEPPAIIRAGDGRLKIAGIARYADVARMMGAEPEIDGAEVDTVAGFVQQRLGRLAKEGDTVRLGNYVLRVDQVRGNRIINLTAEKEDVAAPPPVVS